MRKIEDPVGNKITIIIKLVFVKMCDCIWNISGLFELFVLAESFHA